MKARTNVSIDESLLKSARRYKIVLSSLLETAIREKLRELEAAEWKEENKSAISAYNEFVEIEGVFSEGLRSF